MSGHFTVATVNDDWATVGTNLPRVAEHADLILGQECKRITDDPLPSGWRFDHDTATPARAGSVVAWRRAVLHRTGVHGIRLGVRPRGARMLARWIVWDNLTLTKAPDVRLHVAACHRPPRRYWFLWPAFDRVVAAWVRSRHKRGWVVLIGMDANSPAPQPLIRLTGLRWHHIGIDGFLASPDLRLREVRTLPKGSSDHHPVLADVSIESSGGGSR